MSARFARLSSSDLSNLRLDSPRSPFHFGGLITVEGVRLLDGSGHLRMEEIRERLSRRLVRVPELRRRVFVPGLLRGRALWVDDERFDVDRHVFEAAVEPPGGDIQLLDAATRLHADLLDRSKPLWELWFLTGLSEGRVGVLLKLHHAVADGMAAVAIMGSLFDLEPDAPEPASQPWKPQPPPRAWSLFADNVSNKGRAFQRVGKRVAHPIALAHALRTFSRELARTLGQTKAPRTSLNQPVRPGRRVRFLRVDLAAMKDIAHAHEAKVNDVVLDLWAGGLRDLLLSRSEAVSGVDLITSVAVSLRSSEEAGNLGNQVGVLAVPLPVGEADVRRRLELIAAATRKRKVEQHPAVAQAAIASLAATPVAQCFTAHQHMVNVFSTNLVGPAVPVYVLGARIIDIVPIVHVAGNVAASLCAFSYAGTVFLAVTADATAFPDLDVLTSGMHRSWSQLSAPCATVRPARRSRDQLGR